MKRFLKAVALFLIPITLFYSICFVALIKSGELQSLDTVLNASSNPNILYGLAYRNDVESYKLAMTARNAPAILVLGTSRSMQLGQELFTQASFYNAGGATPRIDYFLHFLNSLPTDALPQKLILVLDQNFFNYSWDGHNTIPDYARNEISPIPFLQQFIQDIARGRVDFAKIFTAPKTSLGLAAIVNNSGFGHDGSYAYGAVANDSTKNLDHDFSDTLNKINIGSERFAYGNTVCKTCISKITDLINYCTEKNIELVGIMPPYAPTVWQQMDSSGSYTYIDKIYTSLQPLFEQSRFELYNYSSFALSSDDEFIDGYHGSDKTYARIMLDIASKTNILKNDISTDLYRLIENDSPYELAK